MSSLSIPATRKRGIKIMANHPSLIDVLLLLSPSHFERELKYKYDQFPSSPWYTSFSSLGHCVIVASLQLSPRKHTVIHDCTIESPFHNHSRHDIHDCILVVPLKRTGLDYLPSFTCYWFKLLKLIHSFHCRQIDCVPWY